MNVLFLGKDNRYNVLIDYLSEHNNVECIGYEDHRKGNLKHISKYDIIILPMYGMKNDMIGDIIITDEIIEQIRPDCLIYTGIIPSKLKNKRIISFMDDKEIKKENDIITVDGIIDKISNCKKNLICILGYGNIGKLLYQRLKKDYLVIVGVKEIKDFDNNSGIFFETSNKEYLKKNLINSSLIINTVPSNIITEDIAPYIKCFILDIASSPYGINHELVEKYHLNYYLYSSIPSKYDPKRAGKVLLRKF